MSKIIYVHCCQSCEVIIPIDSWKDHINSEEHLENTMRLLAYDTEMQRLENKLPTPEFPMGVWKMQPVTDEDEVVKQLKKLT